MSRTVFNALCSERLIDPAIALENENVIEALKSKSTSALIKILDTEF